LQTPAGELEAQWLLGRLEESDYFDFDPRNDVRSLSAFALTYRPAFEPDLSLGFARSVFALADDGALSPGAALDVFRNVGRPNALPATDLTREPRPDQIFSLFGRWIFPASGLETYAEWARFQQPASLRELLSIPNHTQGYTLGLQWAHPWRADSSTVIRLQTEVTNLELSPTFPQQRVISTYASRPVPQGYTHRGQVLGAAIGPGASSQWAAADVFRPGWQAGIFAGRIRSDNAAFYTAAVFRTFHAHDVSVFGGLRGTRVWERWEVEAQFTFGSRLNYLFQNPTPSFQRIDEFAVDVSNQTVQITVRPRMPAGWR
jgi:hypothetical protein